MKRRRRGLIFNLFNPTLYLVYVMSRPLLSKFSKSSNLPHHYPLDYPYPPFFWIMSKYANGEEAKKGQSKFLFCSWQPS
ncbi:MAG: hypothetical protein NY202_00485 [Mollicutes bacterium UO1]